MNEITEMEKHFNEWLDGRPEVIKQMAEKLKPWFRYRLKTTGQHCNLVSYSEDGTVKIDVDGHDNEFLDRINQIFAVRVFGINPDDLEVLVDDVKH